MTQYICKLKYMGSVAHCVQQVFAQIYYQFWFKYCTLVTISLLQFGF